MYYYGSGTAIKVARCIRNGNNITVQDDLTGSDFVSSLSTDLVISQSRFKSDATDEQRQKDWWAMEDNGAIMFNNQYPFFENHSLKISYVYGQRYLDKVIEDACTKLVAMDIMMTDDYTAMFPEGTQNIDLASKAQKLDEEVMYDKIITTDPPRFSEGLTSIELPQSNTQAAVQTPPLPLQPAATQVANATTAPINPATGLTTVETALLSPSEQAIRLKQRV